ncbi:uncharacterized protein LOC134273442 [Saccostrea cucullata]|uniref:uncharacterized protein LOC134273442 n=1 Tax=Saccostrea cuccullata TaxID=36930 RepID=UPI002ED3B7AD
MMEKSIFIILIFLSIHGYLALPAKDETEENNLYPSTTSGKTSSILRDILNQESLVRFSMVQKIQNLVMDAIDSKNNTEILKNKLVYLGKELNALEAMDQRLEQDNAKLQQELSAIYERINDTQNHSLASIQRLNDTEIYLLKRQFLALRRENEVVKLENLKMKEQLNVDVNTARNETSTLKVQYEKLLQKNEAFESNLHRMEKEIKSTNIDSRLMMIEDKFSNFSRAVDKALNDIRKDQNATNIQKLSFLSAVNSDGGSVVAFTAYASSGKDYNSEPIIFNSVITNEGGAYNSNTGIFTSPAVGVYVFTWTHLTRYGQYCHAYLSKNGTIQNIDAHTNLSGLSSGVYTMATMSGTLHLSKGDRVWIQANHCYGFLGAPYNSFSGWKL